MKINIVTPCSRPKNLSTMYNSICSSSMLGSKIDLKWFVIFDSSKVKNLDKRTQKLLSKNFIYYELFSNNSFFGNGQRNRALDLINGDYVYFLDDDNLITKIFFKRIEEIYDLNKYKSFVFNQIRKHKEFKTYPSNIGPEHVDSAQVLIRRDIIGDIRWNNSAYNADGIFIKEVFDKNPDEFVFVDEVLCYYNYLR